MNGYRWIAGVLGTLIVLSIVGLVNLRSKTDVMESKLDIIASEVSSNTKMRTTVTQLEKDIEYIKITMGDIRNSQKEILKKLEGIDDER